MHIGLHDMIGSHKWKWPLKGRIGRKQCNYFEKNLLTSVVNNVLSRTISSFVYWKAVNSREPKTLHCRPSSENSEKFKFLKVLTKVPILHKKVALFFEEDENNQSKFTYSKLKLLWIKFHALFYTIWKLTQKTYQICNTGVWIRRIRSCFHQLTWNKQEHSINKMKNIITQSNIGRN